MRRGNLQDSSPKYGACTDLNGDGRAYMQRHVRTYPIIQDSGALVEN
jgi:hypothetical protein